MSTKKHSKKDTEVKILERLVAPENVAKLEAAGWKMGDATKNHKSLKHMTLEVEVPEAEALEELKQEEHDHPTKKKGHKADDELPLEGEDHA